MRVLGWILLAVAGLTSLQAVLWIPALHSEMVYSDKAADVAQWLEEAAPPVWRSMLSAHNEHVVTTTKLLTWADYRWFEGRYRLVTLAAAMVWMGTAAWLVWDSRRHAHPWATALTLAMTASGFGAVLTGFAYFFQHLGVLAVFVAVRELGLRRRWRWACAALLFGILTNTNAILIAPSLMVTDRQAWRPWAGMTAASFAVWWMLAPHGPVASAPVEAIARFFLDLTALPLYYAGFPAAHLTWAGGVIGVAAATAWWVHRDEVAQRASILFTMGTLALVAAGRAGTEASRFDEKYAVYALWLWLGVLLLGFQSRARHLAAVCAAACIVWVLPVAQEQIFWTNRAFRNEVQTLAAAADFGFERPNIRHILGPDVTAGRVEALRRGQRNLFARPEARAVGRLLPFPDGGACEGDVWDFDRMTQDPTGGLRVHGWVTARNPGSEAAVVYTDPGRGNLVVGYGAFHLPADPPARRPFANLTPPPLLTFSGYTRPDPGTVAIQAWRVREGRACRLGEPKPVAWRRP